MRETYRLSELGSAKGRGEISLSTVVKNGSITFSHEEAREWHYFHIRQCIIAEDGSLDIKLCYPSRRCLTVFLEAIYVVFHGVCKLSSLSWVAAGKGDICK